MTIRPGQFGSIIGVSQTLGSAAGRIYAFNNSSWGVFVCCRALVTTTATVGNRFISVRILDAVGNILGDFVPSQAIPANSTQRAVFGAALGNYSSTGFVYSSTPVEMPIPVNGQIAVFDAANIDVNDTIQPNIVFAI